MHKPIWIPLLFVFVGCVEFVVGFTFIFLPNQIFALAQIAPLARPEFIQLPALLIMVFGLMMLKVAARPKENANLILYISLFKAAVIGLALYSCLTAGMTPLWLIFALFDIAYLTGFIFAYRTIKSS